MRPKPTAVILVYMVLLALAAWPRVLSPGPVELVPKTAAKILWKAGILAGAPVFTTQGTPTDQLKAVYRCLEVRKAPEMSSILYPTSVCPPQRFRWRADPFDATIDHYLIKIIESYGTKRGERLLSAMAHHFCSRPGAGEQVTLLYRGGFLDYQSGDRLEGDRPLAVYDCKQNKIVRAGKP